MRHRIDQRRIAIEIWKALAKIDRLMLSGEGGHHGEDSRADFGKFAGEVRCGHTEYSIYALHSCNVKLFLIDSIALISVEMRAQLVVSGSHGGTSAAKLALAHPPAIVVFNDAGIGLDNAGVAGLRILDEHGVAAVTVAHTSARIGDAASTLSTGVVTYVNTIAATRGIEVATTCQALTKRFVVSS
jgi:hypothetical protein